MDIECSNGAVKTAFDIQVDGKCGPGRPKMTWKQLTEKDCREWKLSAINPHDRNMWRSGVRSAMRAASQKKVYIIFGNYLKFKQRLLFLKFLLLEDFLCKNSTVKFQFS